MAAPRGVLLARRQELSGDFLPKHCVFGKAALLRATSFPVCEL